MSTSLPPQVTKYFWGDNVEELNWNDHQLYITQTILNKGDQDSTKWLLSILDRAQLQKMLPKLKLDPKSKNFWEMYVS